MVFSDPLFIFLFMPVFLILYYVISASFLNAYILVGSLLFYYIGEPEYLWVLLAVIVINYAFGVAIDYLVQPEISAANLPNHLAKAALLLGVPPDLGFLAYFK
jgi:alginate O-acetyltransferase complex protein AlgI